MSKNYLSAVALSWDTILKNNKGCAWIFSRPWDAYIFLKKGRRGRVPYISNRCSKSDNKYLKS